MALQAFSPLQPAAEHTKSRIPPGRNSPRILRQILLVIILGVEELRRVEDFGRDRTMTRLAQRFA